ncbi:MAG TPA: hypothetical protein VGP68_15275 [Gemmataceae bacterium]|nr:hypothetical protein [Gemmataceae bacterium]
MFRFRAVQFTYLTLFALAIALGCKTPSSPVIEPPPPDFKANEITYAENDAFDAIFESALVRQDPVIVVRTDFRKPEWGPHLNAWIAAWNMGGTTTGRTIRGQSPLPSIVIDGDSIREFRLLIGGLMTRVDDLARGGSTWWTEDRMRSRRIDLLKPYNLRFHKDEDGTIRVVFFNGNYARYYPAYMQNLTRSHETPDPWARTFECTECKRLMTARGQQGN